GRQPQGDARPAADPLADADPPAVRLDDVARYGEAEAGAVRAGGEEGLEDAGAQLGRHAGAGVGDRDLDRAVRRRGRERDLAAARRRLRRVGEEPEEHLADEIAVGAHLGQRRGLVAPRPGDAKRMTASGLRTSCATAAASWPSAASFSLWARRARVAAIASVCTLMVSAWRRSRRRPSST